MGLWDVIGSLFNGGGDAAASIGSNANAVSDWLPQTTQGFDFAPVAEQAWAPAAAAAPSAGSSFGNVASSIGSGLKDAVSGFGNVAKSVLPAAQLGAAGLGIANTLAGQGQQSKMTRLAERSANRADEIARTQQAAARPIQDFSASRLQAAETGQLPPGEEERIQAWLNGTRQQMRQALAGKGMGDSTSLLQLDAWLDSVAAQMRGAALRDLSTQGVNAAGQAGNILAGATGSTQAGGQMAVQQQGSLQKAIEDAQRMMAQLNAA